MQVFELQGYKSQTSGHTLQTYLESLIDNHKVKLHNGQFALVIDAPGVDYVYKLWTKDEAFEHWMSVCKKHNNPNLPKFIGRVKTLPNFFIRRKGFESPIKIVKMEKLKPFDMKYKNLGERLYQLYANGASLDTIIRIFTNKETPKEFIMFVKNIMPIIEHEKPVHFTFDLHPGNIMMRGSTLVLTDALATNSAVGKVDGKITQQMDTGLFLNQPIYNPSGSLITGRRSSVRTAELSDIPSKLKKSYPNYWKTTEAYEYLDLDSFPKDIVKKEDIFDFWEKKYATIPYNAMVTFCLYADRKILKSICDIRGREFIKAYARAYAEYSVTTKYPSPPNFVTVIKPTPENISALFMFLMDEVVSEDMFIDIFERMYKASSSGVLETIRMNYIEDDYIKAIIQTVLSVEDYPELEELYKEMQ